MVSGLDLVNWQLQLQVPGLTPPDLTAKDAYPPSGWAIEVRINAEDPFRNLWTLLRDAWRGCVASR